MDATLQGQDLRLARPIQSARMSPDDLLGLIDVARVLGISQSTAKNYARRPDFPTPHVLARGRVWRRADVAKWAKDNLPFKPGPKPRT